MSFRQVFGINKDEYIKCPVCKRYSEKYSKNCYLCGYILNEGECLIEYEDADLLDIYSVLGTIAVIMALGYPLVSWLIIKYSSHGTGVLENVAFTMKLLVYPILQIVLGKLSIFLEDFVFEAMADIGILLGIIGMIISVILGIVF